MRSQLAPSTRTDRSTHPESGFSIPELAVSIAILSVLAVGILPVIGQLSRAFSQNQAASALNLRAEDAVERLIGALSQAISIDEELEVIGGGTSGPGLHYRTVNGFSDGEVVYDDTPHIFVCGPQSGTVPVAGVLIGRALELETVHALGAGDDGVLGTEDDDTRASAGGTDGVPAVELLLSDRYAPRTGPMLTIEQDGLAITFTLRLNVQSRGEWVLLDDLVLSETLALRQ